MRHALQRRDSSERVELDTHSTGVDEPAVNIAKQDLVFAVKNELTSKLSSIPQGINDHLMTLKLPFSGGRQATIISMYSPAMTNPDDIKDKFYGDLHSLTAAVPKKN